MKPLLNTIRFNDFFEDFPGPLVIVDSNFNIKSFNKSFVRRIGHSVREDDNLKIYIAEKQRPAFDNAIKTFSKSSSKTCQLTIQLIKKDHSLRWGEIYIAKIHDLLPQMYFLHIRDITKSKIQQLKLEEAKNAAEKTAKSTIQMLANTSHELRTPIHTIMGMTELLDDSKMDEEQEEYSSQIRYSADTLLALINDILDYSKLEAGKVELEEIEFPLIELVESAVDMLTLEAHKKFVDIGIDIDSETPEEILGDPVRLRQIIVNLVNNAVKFTEKGEVVVSLSVKKIIDDTISIEFRVSDSGVGIPEEKQAKLFSAFQQADSSTTRKYGGTGLGLFISRSLVSQMGGHINFESTAGKGTDFFFTLPMKRSAFVESESLIPKDFYSGIPVLIVDDNKRIRDILYKYLTSWGCVVSQAASSSEALVLLKIAAKENRSFKICLADQLMPGGDGWQLASEIHSDPSLSETRILLMLLKGKGAEEAKMMKLGWVHDYVKKPIRKEVLLKKIFSVLNRELKEIEDAELIELPSTEEIETLESAEPIETEFNVLIAEDHITNQKLFKTILEKENLLVSLANDGQEALDKCQQQHFDLIFMDCQMPVMNGYLATEKIRDMGINTPIIAVTASAVQEEKERCLACGMTDFLTKPFKRKDLLPFFDKYLNTSGIKNTVDLRVADSGHNDFSENENIPAFDYKDALHTFMGNRDTLVGLLPAFMERTREQIGRLKVLCGEELNPQADSDEYEEAVRLAHTIKGASKNLSMMILGQNAERIENFLKQDNIPLDEIKRDLLLLEENFKQLNLEVNSILSENQI